MWYFQIVVKVHYKVFRSSLLIDLIRVIEFEGDLAILITYRWSNHT